MRELRGLIRDGYARDLAPHYGGDAAGYGEWLRGLRLRQVGYSAGRYGVTGALLESEGGDLWAIVGRCSALYATV